MKITFFKVALIICAISLSFISCEKEESTEELNILTFQERMDNLDKLDASIIEFYNYSEAKKSSQISKIGMLKERELIKSVVQNSKKIFSYLGVDEEFLKSIAVENENISEVNTDDIYCFWSCNYCKLL